MGRSLWLDEAWVANAVNAPTLAGMFYYPNWLQTSPPLFLLLERWSISVIGLSNISLRMVPLALALVAVAGMLAVARRVVSPSFAALACAALAFHPTTVEYFRSVKQYSGEVAATTLVLLATVWYLQSPDRRRYWWLLGAIAVAMPLSYPTVFLLPGVLWVVHRRALLAAVAGGMLAILYWWFIRPNVSSALEVYWSAGGRDLWTPVVTGVVTVAVVGVAALPRFGIRGRVAMVCALPYIPFAIAEAAGWYPESPRTSLFLRPCLVLLLIMVAAEISGRWNRVAVDSIALLLAILTVFLGMRKQFHEGRFQPEEDFAGRGPVSGEERGAWRYRAGACVPARRISSLYGHAGMAAGQRRLRRYGMAVLSSRQGRAAGLVDRTCGDRGSGWKDSARFCGADLVVPQRPADALGLHGAR